MIWVGVLVVVVLVLASLRARRKASFVGKSVARNMTALMPPSGYFADRPEARMPKVWKVGKDPRL